MDTRPLAPGTLLKGRYRVTRLIAGGGMAWVYEVVELRADGTSPRWALKELRADLESTDELREARALFEQEANILVRLSHPNLPRVVAFFEEDGRSYLVMEYVQGESLQVRLERANSPLIEAEVVDWGIQICDVLEYLHRRPVPVIFRDLKPSNIMVTPRGDVKLVDFGIARTYKVGQRRDTVTMGSENYAAPEQWGDAQTDARSDIYGLGATMYHLLTNVPPLPALVPSPRAPLREQNPAVSAATAEIVERAMARDRASRYDSAAQMQQALLAALPRRERRRAQQRLAERRASAAAAQAGEHQAGPASGGVDVGDACMPASGERGAGRVCAWCATPNRPGATYCRHCGDLLDSVQPATLRLSHPGGDDYRVTLTKRVTLLGRSGGALPVDVDLSAFDPRGYVSRNHARITAYRNRYHVIDLDSANGTYLNGRRLGPHRAELLRPGDRIRMGRIEMEFDGS